MYTLNQYFMSRNIIEIPYIIVIPFIYVVINYWMIGLHHAFIIVLMSFTATSAGMFAGSIVTNPKSVSNMVTIIPLPLLAFSGYFKNFLQSS